MKKTILLLLVLISLSISWNCGTQETKENRIFHLNLDNCNTAIDLKLSDLIDSCQLIPLETTNESLIGNFIKFLYISKNFILIIDQNGVYKFQSNGTFIRKIINIGRGPDELSGSGRYFYYEKDDILFIENDFVQDDKIMRYDIKLEIFLPSIKKCFPTRWTDFIIYEDSLIMGSIEGVSRGETNPYALFIQNFKGEFITGIKSHRSYILPRGEGEEILQRLSIYSGDKTLHVKYQFDDTLFSLKNNNLSAYLIPQYKNKATLPKMLPFEGDRKTYYNQFENPSFIILNYSIFKGWTAEGGMSRAHYKYDYYILNKTNGNYGVIKSYTDDFIGKIQTDENETMTFPSSLPNNKLYVSYLPNELLNITDHQDKNYYSKNLFSQLDQIKRKLNDTDNPILLIGTTKKKLQILK